MKMPNGLTDYAKQMCAEYRDERGLWQCPEGKANHLWDCEQMGIALALYLGFHTRRRESPIKSAAVETPQPNSRPGWFFNRR